MFRDILVAVDGSETSLRAARYAGRLAAATGASIRVLTVHDAPSAVLGEPAYSAVLERALKEAEAHLAAAVEVIAGTGGPKPAGDRLAGPPAEAIMRAAETGGHDLIVVGNRGRGRIAGALLGSVSGEIASRARIPVLIVPHEAD